MLYTSFKRNDKKDIKVAQLAGSVGPGQKVLMFECVRMFPGLYTPA